MQVLLTSRKFRVIRIPVPAVRDPARDFEFVQHPGAVVVLPLLSDDEVIMIRNFRHTVGQELWELPAGTLDLADEKPIAAAGRELEEETGYRAGRIEPLCEFYPSPGVMNELIRAYSAHSLTKTVQMLEPTEQITVQPMPLGEAVSMACDGRIRDAKTIITLLQWDRARRMTA